MNIAAILEHQAQRLGDRTAIVERGRRISFSELNYAAACAVEDLSRAGLAPGMRALVFSPMSIDLYTTVIAMFRLGVTAVFVDPSAGSANLAASIACVRPNAFVGVPRSHLLRLTSAAVRAIPIKVSIGPGTMASVLAMASAVTVASAVRRKGADGPARPLAACDANTPAIITFTSGTTGQPKAAVRTHGFLLAQHRALVESLRLESGEADLTTLPIFALANLAAGVTTIIPDTNLRNPAAIDPEPLLEQIRKEGATRIVASPAVLERLAATAAASGRRLETLRRIFTGGGPVFPRTLEAIASVAPQATIVAVYGSTEAEPIATLDMRDISQADRVAMQQGAGLLAGRPAASLDVRILPDRWGRRLNLRQRDFDADTLGAGCAGEIVVAGDHVLSGYLNGVGDEDTKLTVGGRVWHRTGDAGYFDAHGRLWLLGRCEAKVTDAAGTLYPLAVECAASDVPGVRRSAFVQHGGRRVLVIDSDDCASALRETLLRRLGWARVADVIALARIPVDRRHNAKIDLPALRSVLGQHHQSG